MNCLRDSFGILLLLLLLLLGDIVLVLYHDNVCHTTQCTPLALYMTSFHFSSFTWEVAHRSATATDY